MRFERLADWLSWQETLHPSAIDLGLERVARTLRRLGWRRPACPVFTVAGTNGKGSVVALSVRILREAGYAPAEIARVQELIRRDRLATDAGSQAVEDAACLVFIETQLQSMEAKLDHEHLVDVLRKSARKMSPAGIAAVGQIDLGPDERALLHEALTG